MLEQVRAALMNEFIGVLLVHISWSLALHRPYTKGEEEGKVTGGDQER